MDFWEQQPSLCLWQEVCEFFQPPETCKYWEKVTCHGEVGPGHRDSLSLSQTRPG